MKMVYTYFNFKIYYFISLFYQINLDVFIGEYRLDCNKYVWLVDLLIFKRSEGKQNPALQRAFRNKPRVKMDSDSSTKIQTQGMLMKDLLKTFAKKLINHKFEGLEFQARCHGLEYPPELTVAKGGIEDHYTLFLNRVMMLDPFFENRLFFYLAKDKVDYQGVDRFLNSCILRYFPQLRPTVELSDIKTSPRKTVDTPLTTSSKNLLQHLKFPTQAVKPNWFSTVDLRAVVANQPQALVKIPHWKKKERPNQRMESISMTKSAADLTTATPNKLGMQVNPYRVRSLKSGQGTSSSKHGLPMIMSHL